jgi:pyridinium-3,5-biscarboxylic acid mononucleotide sulfurtransferase
MGAPLLQLVAPRSEEEILGRIAAGGPALVALSGGVDSSLVAVFARRALGSRSLAVTVSGPAVAPTEVERAADVARAIGIAHRVVEVDPLTVPEYRANPTDRCFHCRRIESDVLLAIGRERGLVQFLDGIHRDDLSEDRPGLRAMDAAGFDHPLAWAGWSKQDVRASARDHGLGNWDLPSDACLASRVSHGDPISRELLGRIAQGEEWLRSRGFRRVRVRIHGNSARVEVGPDEVPRLRSEPLASEVRRAIGALGFDRVELDPRGYHGAPPGA